MGCRQESTRELSPSLGLRLLNWVPRDFLLSKNVSLPCSPPPQIYLSFISDFFVNWTSLTTLLSPFLLPFSFSWCFCFFKSQLGLGSSSSFPREGGRLGARPSAPFTSLTEALLSISMNICPPPPPQNFITSISNTFNSLDPLGVCLYNTCSCTLFILCP